MPLAGSPTPPPALSAGGGAEPKFGRPRGPKSSGGAIGLFDSGVGGLTVARELLRVLPDERIVYLGDTARVPYGNKSKETVLKFSMENTLFLLRHKVKLIVLACHTSSSFALPFLERRFKHPMLGVVEPGVEAALEVTRSGRVGVIGTNATIGSRAYPRSIRARDPKVKVFQNSCPLFVPLAEEGWLEGPVAEQVARRYLKPLQVARVDTLILGCTHYPLLKSVIAKVMGPKVSLIDSARQVALKTKDLLNRLRLTAPPCNGSSPVHRFFVTDEPRSFGVLSRRFLGKRLGDVTRI